MVAPDLGTAIMSSDKPKVDIKATAQAAIPHIESICAAWLPEGKRQGHDWIARNPTRDDQTAGSFSVSLITGGCIDHATGEKCHDIISTIRYLDGLPNQGEAARRVADFIGTAPITEAKPAPTKPAPKAMKSRPEKHLGLGKPSAQWEYRSADGNLICVVCRFEITNSDGEPDKTYRPLTVTPEGWYWRAPPEPRPLYGLDRLAARPNAEVIVCEGEKAADAAEKLFPECVAVSSMNGAQSPNKSDWTPLEGRRLRFWRDADQAGSDYTEAVKRLCAGATSISWLDVSAWSDGYDAADALADGWTADQAIWITAEAKIDPTQPPPRRAMFISEDELAQAKLTPKCIVMNHTYADVAQVVAPGGTGKTTMLLYEAVCMALGWRVWGLETVTPGWTLIVTAEDRRDRLIARLREMLASLKLTPAQRATVLQSILIWDVTGLALKLVAVSDGNLVLTALADQIVETYQDDPPIVVLFDPLVSFGASESMVNDNEQAIVTAARRIVNGLDCCVRVVHHTGKANARGGTLDQYSGRGGSALADGSRMTTVIQGWSEANIAGLQPPQGCEPENGSSISILSRAKLSYSPPDLPLIWIKRTGFKFEHFVEIPRTKEDIRNSKADQLERFLVSQLKNGHYHTQRTLETICEDLKMTRVDVRGAVAVLRAGRRVFDNELPSDKKKGRKQTYLHPSSVPTSPQPEEPAVQNEEVSIAPSPSGAIGYSESPKCAAQDDEVSIAPPLRDLTCGALPLAGKTQVPSKCAKNDGAIAAQLAQLKKRPDSEFLGDLSLSGRFSESEESNFNCAEVTAHSAQLADSQEVLEKQGADDFEVF